MRAKPLCAPNRHARQTAMRVKPRNPCAARGLAPLLAGAGRADKKTCSNSNRASCLSGAALCGPPLARAFVPVVARAEGGVRIRTAILCLRGGSRGLPLPRQSAALDGRQLELPPNRALRRVDEPVFEERGLGRWPSVAVHLLDAWLLGAWLLGGLVGQV